MSYLIILQFLAANMHLAVFPLTNPLGENMPSWEHVRLLVLAVPQQYDAVVYATALVATACIRAAGVDWLKSTLTR